jgi:G6PDH family F420-dependent oxidoreductase
VRHEMFGEAIEIISRLLDGGYVNYVGDHFRVDSAKVWDLPEVKVPIGAAVSGDQSIARFAPLVDHLISTEPEAELVQTWDAATEGRASRKIGQIPICWDADEEKALAKAHDQFRWFAGGWAVNSDLSTTAGFEGATQFVRPEDVAESIPCGPDLDAIVDAIRKYWEAGFTDIALVQIGDDSQELFLKEAAGSLLEKLRTESH